MPVYGFYYAHIQIHVFKFIAAVLLKVLKELKIYFL